MYQTCYVPVQLKQHQIRQQLRLVTPPTDALVLGLPILKKHCRLPLEEDFTDEDENLTIYGKAAEALVESHAEMSLHHQVWCLDIHHLPKRDAGNDRHIIRLEKMPIVSLDSVKYYDNTDQLQTVSTSVYNGYLSTAPPTVWLDASGLNPTGQTERLDRFQFQFTAGSPIVDGSATVQATAKQAILFLVGTWFQKRETIHLWTGKPLMEMPLGYQLLIGQLQWRL